MNVVLNANEARVLGCLIEKSVLTPDQYPLTLNALVNACNQKTSRDPVMALDAGTVQHTLRQLEARHLGAPDTPRVWHHLRSSLVHGSPHPVGHD